MQTTTRKGLPLPEVTDVAGTNYSVGPAGRTISITGKVRDDNRGLANLIDTFLEYNQDETVTGRFDFQSPFITEKGSGQLFLNSTGGVRSVGDVVIIDPANDSSIILPTAAGISAAKVGVVAESINNGSVGRVAFSGFIRIKVAAGVTRNQYLTTQNASAIAAGSATGSLGAFAFSVTTQDVNNTVLAYLHPGATIENGGQILGTLGIGVAQINNAGLIIGGSITGISGSAWGEAINPTLIADQNNAILYGLHVNPTFNDNSKTGVSHYDAVFAPVASASDFGYIWFAGISTSASNSRLLHINQGGNKMSLRAEVNSGSPGTCDWQFFTSNGSVENAAAALIIDGNNALRIAGAASSGHAGYLFFPSGPGDKILLEADSSSSGYGIGLNAGEFSIFVPGTASFTFRSGGSLSGTVLATLSTGGYLQLAGGVGFFGGATPGKQTVTGSRGGNAALASLLTALAAYGLITDSSSV